MMGVVGVADVALIGMELWLLVQFVFGKKKEKKKVSSPLALHYSGVR